MSEEDASHMLQQRIRLLHEYNDFKDTATMLIGMYAQKTGKTLQEVYEQFNINSNMDQ
ncbi:hCG18570-like protein [Circinella umbellata]|nr:hCG18570-like protein [Circinella umbellata]